MTLEAGSRIGPYEVLAPVGAGGMGEVWRARDPRIGREVAIKVLPKEYAESSDRLHRFEQEARAAGSLSHPNLVTIHEFGTHDGAPYIAMEMLEGATLREKLRGGHGSSGSAIGVGTPLPPRKAVEIAMQVATGLAAAHDKGLVHRDLKPENIFLTGDGIAKILDFGLVKLSSNFGGDFAEQATVPRSAPGVALGTVGYMSPEQVSGGVVDGRSDIFSLGAVIYELLSGKRAFHGPTAIETMNAILHEDPPALSGETSRIPPTLDRIVRRCLEKEPRQRFQSARDVVFALEAIGDTSTGSGDRMGLTRVRLRSLISVASIAVAFLSLAAAAVFWRQARVRTEALEFRQITFGSGNTTHARFSPDGQTIYYSASWDGAPTEVFAVGRDGSGSRSVGAPGAELMSVSSTGELAVLRHDVDDRGGGSIGTLARVPIGGGSPRDISDRVVWADWLPGTDSLAAIRLVGDRWVLEAPLGKVIYTPERGYGMGRCRVAPDGSRIAFLEGSKGGLRLKVIDRTGKVDWTFGPISSAKGLSWSSDGERVLVSGRLEKEERGDQIAAIGRERKPIQVISSPGEIWFYDVAQDGALLLDPATGDHRIVILNGSDAERTLSWRGQSKVVSVVPSGDAILFVDRSPSSAAAGPYVRRIDGSPPIFLGDYLCGAITPDGSAALVSPKSDVEELLLLSTGAGTPRRLGRWTSIRGTAVLPEGKTAIVLGTPAGLPEGIYRVALADGSRTHVSSPNILGIGRPSPDSRMISVRTIDLLPAVLHLDEAADLRVVPGARKWETIAGWSQSSKEIFLESIEFPRKLYRVDLQSGKRVFARTVMPRDASGVMATSVPWVLNDGRTLVYNEFRVTNSNLWIAERRQ